MTTVFLKSPQGVVKEIEATAAALTPYIATGWHQVPAPASAPALPPSPAAAPGTVLMESPKGETKEVPATPAALTPVMVAGWHEVPAPAKPPQTGGK